MTIDQALQSAFPGLAVIELKLEGLRATAADPALVAFRKEVQERIRGSIRSLDAVKDHPTFRAYRDFFWRVGIDPTKTRPAGEALVRRILAGRDLPTINTIVDAYNIASAETAIAIAAFDLAAVDESSLAMRKAAAGELFHGIGMDRAETLQGVEVVIEDRRSARLIAVYPYRDSDDSKVVETSRNVLFMMCGVPGIDPDALRRAAELTEEYVRRFCSSP